MHGQIKTEKRRYLWNQNSQMHTIRDRVYRNVVFTNTILFNI